MCLALYKPAGIKADWNKLQNGMEHNSDGAGFAVAVDGQLIVEKGFFKFEQFKMAFEPFEMYDAIVHFRMATHGDKNKANCHPFDLRDFEDDLAGEASSRTPVAVIHNGIFSQANDDQKQWSDTWHVCRDLLAPLWLSDDKCFEKAHLIEMGDHYVGTYNKLVFLDATGKCSIWGEKNGHWKDGSWYSNYSYSDYRYANPMYAGTGKSGVKYMPATRTGWSLEDDDEWNADVNSKYSTSYGKLRLEVGKRYVARNGIIVGPLEANHKSAGMFPWLDPITNKSYTSCGSFTTALGIPNDSDLIEEFEDEPVMNLDLELPVISLIAVKYLRECGYTDHDLERLYIDEDHSGLLSELAAMYNMSEDDVTIFIDDELRQQMKDDALERQISEMSDADFALHDRQINEQDAAMAEHYAG